MALILQKNLVGMRGKSWKKCGIWTAGLLALAAAPASRAHAADVNQSQAQVTSYNVNNAGSDQSLKTSTTYAMQALMDLAGQKLPSAMNNGYKAYGDYRNSQNLDKMKDLNAANANALGSIDSAPVLNVPTSTVTSYRRLDPNFLKEGDYAKVAAEFERQTGMSRGEFLNQLASASEEKISRRDPMMIDKVFTRFEGFLQKIPNAEFRAKAEKSLNMVPNTVRRGVVAKAVTALAGFFANGSPPANPTSLTAQKDAAAAASAATAAKAEAPKATDLAAERKPAATGAGAVTAASLDDKSGFGGIVEAAIQTQDQSGEGGATIFQQVSKRYRILTPLISKLP